MGRISLWHNWHFPDKYGGLVYFICLLAIWISYFVKCLFKSFVHSSITLLNIFTYSRYEQFVSFYTWQIKHSVGFYSLWWREIPNFMKFNLLMLLKENSGLSLMTPCVAPLWVAQQLMGECMYFSHFPIEFFWSAVCLFCYFSSIFCVPDSPRCSGGDKTKSQPLRCLHSGEELEEE